MSNTRNSDASGYPNTEKWIENEAHLKTRHIFDRPRGVWLTDETRFRVFNIHSFSKHQILKAKVHQIFST